jgi:hypothetical protein
VWQFVWRDTTGLAPKAEAKITPLYVCRLRDSAIGAHLRSDRFESSLAEILELQVQMMENVAGAVPPYRRPEDMARLISGLRLAAPSEREQRRLGAPILIWFTTDRASSVVGCPTSKTTAPSRSLQWKMASGLGFVGETSWVRTTSLAIFELSIAARSHGGNQRP